MTSDGSGCGICHSNGDEWRGAFVLLLLLLLLQQLQQVTCSKSVGL